MFYYIIIIMNWKVIPYLPDIQKWFHFYSLLVLFYFTFYLYFFNFSMVVLHQFNFEPPSGDSILLREIFPFSPIHLTTTIQLQPCHIYIYFDSQTQKTPSPMAKKRIQPSATKNISAAPRDYYYISTDLIKLLPSNHHFT